MFENPRRGRQAINFTTNAPKILDLKSSSEQIFSRKLPLGAPVHCKSDAIKSNNDEIPSNTIVTYKKDLLLFKIIQCKVSVFWSIFA